VLATGSYSQTSSDTPTEAFPDQVPKYPLDPIENPTERDRGPHPKSAFLVHEFWERSIPENEIQVRRKVKKVI
jgi:hypothetical protein